jgi:hypothetical protein
MSRWPIVRLAVGLTIILVALVWILRARLDPARANLHVTLLFCAVTAVYALITFEILLQNQAMARAATDSTKVMERSLRFSYAPNLLYLTINTRDPTLDSRVDCTPINNEDYQAAMLEYGGGGQQKEFVFAIVQNVGRGAATNLTIDVNYKIRDSSNTTKNYSVTKQAAVQILESGKAVALCICVSKVPTNGDQVTIISSILTTSDFYRDALDEPPQTFTIEAKSHHVESEPGSVVRIA